MYVTIPDCRDTQRALDYAERRRPDFENCLTITGELLMSGRIYDAREWAIIAAAVRDSGLTSAERVASVEHLTR